MDTTTIEDEILYVQPNPDYERKKVIRSTRQHNKAISSFNSRTGPDNHTLTYQSRPIEFFMLILPESTIEELLNWTNKKAESKISNPERRKQKKAMWSDLTLCEMKMFIGCIILMGIVKLPKIDMYWNKTTGLFSIPGLRLLIPQQRFKDIYSCLCLRNPTQPGDDNPTHKIRPLVDSVIFNSQFYYRPERELSVDESMIAFNGRSSLKVYMPLKPIKYGLKAYVLCESSTGYMINWQLYTGKIKKTENNIPTN